MLGFRAAPWGSNRNALSELGKSAPLPGPRREFSLSGKMVTEI
jgi:hypothetical protein